METALAATPVTPHATIAVDSATIAARRPSTVGRERERLATDMDEV
jgi:hypothetical protein